MTKTLEAGAKVRITNVFGFTSDEQLEPNFRLTGQEGYIYEVLNQEWLHVLVPTHRHYSIGSGAMLRISEVELL